MKFFKKNRLKCQIKIEKEKIELLYHIIFTELELCVKLVHKYKYLLNSFDLIERQIFEFQKRKNCFLENKKTLITIQDYKKQTSINLS